MLFGMMMVACKSASVGELNEVDVDPVDLGDENPPGADVFELDTSADPDLVFTATGSNGGEQNGTWSEYNVRIVRDGDALTDLSIDFVVNTDSVVTGNSMLDNHLRTEDFFDTAGFPKGTFASKQIVQAGDGYDVTGDLTLRGTTREITWRAQIEDRGDRLVSTAEISFSRFDFGLVEPGTTAPGGDGTPDPVVLTYAVELAKI